MTAIESVAAAVALRNDLRREMVGAVEMGDCDWAERLDDRIARLTHDIRMMAREAMADVVARRATAHNEVTP